MVRQRQRPVFNRAKFDNLVLYVVSKSPDPTELGAVRLRKILYYADSLNFLHFGRAITGATYVKWGGGPVPKELSRTLGELDSEGALKAKRATHPLGYPMVYYYAFRAPDLNLFSAEEISVVDEVIQAICERHTAASISRLSHHNAWEIAQIGEELPYESVFVQRFGEIDEDAIAWAREEIRRYEARSPSAG